MHSSSSAGNWEVFPAFNNNLIYTERRHAGYVMAGNKFNKLSVQAGLRGEYSDIRTELTQTDESNPRFLSQILIC